MEKEPFHYPVQNYHTQQHLWYFCTKIRRTIMETKNSFISSASVKVQGRTAYYKMLEAVRQGELIQVCRGVYANIDRLSACMVDIESIVPNGILCLWSAWNIQAAYVIHASGLSCRHQKG